MKAICCIYNDKTRKLIGYVIFDQPNSKSETTITATLEDMTPGLHGFHIHQGGDLREGCKSLGGHYNPFNKTHGGPKSKIRHVGDLGNIKIGKNGKGYYKIKDKQIKLYGKYSIIGRSVVVHSKEDDLGLGGDEESLITGNAGSRVGCGIIGYL